MDRYKVLIQEINGVELQYPCELEFDAVNMFYDNTVINLLDAENVQAALDEIVQKLGVTASPGVSFGRSGNLSTGTWLFSSSVPSNRAGAPIFLYSAEITGISMAIEDPEDFTIQIVEHEGDNINPVNVGTFSMVVADGRSKAGSVSFPITRGKQLGIYILAGSPKNLRVDIQTKGTILP